MSGLNIGGSNRTMYDNCAYQKNLMESVSPLQYNLWLGKFEHCAKCTDKQFYTKYQLVDVETELRNQTRVLSKCDQFKYSPSCKKSGLCLSTFDPSVPVVPAPEVCPIIYNNIPKVTHPGYTLPNPNPCKR